MRLIRYVALGWLFLYSVTLWGTNDLNDSSSRTDQIHFKQRIKLVKYIISQAEKNGTKKQLINSILNQTNSVNRQNIAPLLSLAEIHNTSGDYSQARYYLLKAIEYQPKNSELLLMWASLVESAGKYNQAEVALKQAYDLDLNSRNRE